MNNEELLNKIQTLKQKRDSVTEAYDFQITLLSAELEAMLKKDHLPNCKTESATAYWQNTTKVEVTDWNAVMEFVYKNKAIDILQRRISPAQLEKRIDAGAKLDGVTFVKGTTFIIKGKKDES